MMEYHEESYDEQMEAQHGPYDSYVAPPSHSQVDTALERIEGTMDDWSGSLQERLPGALKDIQKAIQQARQDLGIPAKINA